MMVILGLWLLLLDLVWPPVEFPLGPHCFLAIHGVDDDDQDSGIKPARQEAKVPIQDAIHVLIS